MVKCKTESGFEDQLTTSASYTIVELKGGSVSIVNDKGETRWYGLSNFSFELCT